MLSQGSAQDSAFEPGGTRELLQLNPLIYPDEEIEIQRSEVSCLRSHCDFVAGDPNS